MNNNFVPIGMAGKPRNLDRFQQTYTTPLKSRDAQIPLSQFDSWRAPPCSFVKSPPIAPKYDGLYTLKDDSSLSLYESRFANCKICGAHSSTHGIGYAHLFEPII